MLVFLSLHCEPVAFAKEALCFILVKEEHICLCNFL